MMENKFSIEDDKFSIIASELQSRNWKKHDTNYNDHPGLIWTNLAKLDFHSVSDNSSIVNHLRGSQNLSNKALLAYHVSTSRRDNREVWVRSNTHICAYTVCIFMHMYKYVITKYV
jgi:hypothetical protein